MAYQGINFRATSGYVVDGAGDTYCLGDVYPTTRGGYTFGWDSGVSAADRNAGNPPQLAGINYFFVISPTTHTFRLDLPAPGTYAIRIADGDTNAQGNQQIIIKDNTTTLATIANNLGSNNTYIDATSVIRTSASDWVSNNAYVVLTFATTIANFECGGVAGGTAQVIAHLSVETATPTGVARGTVDCSLAVSSLAGSGGLAR